MSAFPGSTEFFGEFKLCFKCLFFFSLSLLLQFFGSESSSITGSDIQTSGLYCHSYVWLGCKSVTDTPHSLKTNTDAEFIEDDFSCE